MIVKHGFYACVYGNYTKRTLQIYMLARPRFYAYATLILVSTPLCIAFYAYDFIVVGFKLKNPTKRH